MATHRERTKCGEVKALTEFAPHARGKYGRQPRCHACQNEANKARYWANHAAAKEKSRLRALAEQRADPEKRNAQRRAWAERNPDADRAAKRKWAEANPEKLRDASRGWHERNKEQNKACTRGYRARKRDAPGRHTAEDVERLLVEQCGRCNACRCELVRFDVDHVVPLVRGGSNGPENLQLLCIACNRTKSRRTHAEFMASR